MSIKKIDAILDRIVKESIALAVSSNNDEQHRQDDLARRLRSTDNQEEKVVLVDEEEAEEAEEQEEPESPDEAEKKKPEEKTHNLEIPAELKFQDIRKMIDQVRSGRSLKDPETKLELVDYYDKLDEPDRIALYKFLGSISAILTKDIDGDDAPTPAQGKGKVITKSKTNVHAPDPNRKKIVKQLKQVQQDKKEKSVKKVDRSSPEKEFDAPIKVGESQDKQTVIVEMLKLAI